MATYPQGMPNATRIAMTDPEGNLLVDRSGSGWAIYRSDELGSGEVRLRLAQAGDDARAEIREVWVVGTERVSARMLREIPLGRIEATLQSPTTWKNVRKHVPAAEGRAPFPEGTWRSREDIPASPDPMRVLHDWKRFVLSEDEPKEDRLKATYLLFTALKSSSRSPAKQLSRAWDDTPTSTIHYWVKEARQMREADPAGDLSFSTGEPIDLVAGPPDRG